MTYELIDSLTHSELLLSSWMTPWLNQESNFFLLKKIVQNQEQFIVMCALYVQIHLIFHSLNPFPYQFLSAVLISLGICTILVSNYSV